MTIEILPARLANQIAAGEVVERPASVIKELVENSLDAGATKIQIDIEKGGAKRIRITDNGSGIAKEELTLALSRHATSKIKDLNDLEAISSLGFRGEALASISSVARLTLTSKPAEQEAAWQACAEGRDMNVLVQPAAHPDGTTINVKDLFFNTPARRKFLRTEKTEFSHIEEVVRRIALAKFDVTFILAHNGKVVRQYRAARDSSQYQKRVAQVCGQSFIDQALVVDCQHDDIKLWGWIAKPDFFRNQNDLCYSYVNGRMMRDKLINHAIRQAYADLIPSDSYPAFVLFLQLDFREVDVNVHPAKHEVRFQQGRYVHDFIYSVCNRVLQADMELASQIAPEQNEIAAPVAYETAAARDFVKPLEKVSEGSATPYQAQYSAGAALSARAKQTSQRAAQAYQNLMTPHVVSEAKENGLQVTESNPGYYQELIADGKVLQLVQSRYAVIRLKEKLRLLSLTRLAKAINYQAVVEQWSRGVVSQPLLLPAKLNLTREQFDFVTLHQKDFEQIGILFVAMKNANIQIRQFPALLREKDVGKCFVALTDLLMACPEEKLSVAEGWQKALAQEMVLDSFEQDSASALLLNAGKIYQSKLEQELLLNSVELDLTSEISQLEQQHR